MKHLVAIPNEFDVDLLKRATETGMGYQVISVELRDGRTFDQVVTSEGGVFFPGFPKSPKRLQHHSDTEDPNVHTASHECEWKHGESVLHGIAFTQCNEFVGCDGGAARLLPPLVVAAIR
jgi:hypothetical protein